MKFRQKKNQDQKIQSKKLKQKKQKIMKKRKKSQFVEMKILKKIHKLKWKENCQSKQLQRNQKKLQAMTQIQNSLRKKPRKKISKLKQLKTNKLKLLSKPLLIDFFFTSNIDASEVALVQTLLTRSLSMRSRRGGPSQTAQKTR